VQDALTDLFDEMSVDYIQLTSECIQLLELIKDVYNVELLQHEFERIDFPASTIPQEGKSWEYLRFVREAFGKAIMTREMKLFSHQAADGDTRVMRGRDPGVKNPYRHGIGFHRLTLMNQISVLLASTTYVVLYFYPDHDQTQRRRDPGSVYATHRFAEQLSKTDILAFGEVNRDRDD
jgi:hypothetical protein